MQVPTLAGKTSYVTDNVLPTAVFEPGRTYKKVGVNSNFTIFLNPINDGECQESTGSTPIFDGSCIYIHSESLLHWRKKAVHLPGHLCILSLLRKPADDFRAVGLVAADSGADRDGLRCSPQCASD